MRSIRFSFVESVPPLKSASPPKPRGVSTGNTGMIREAKQKESPEVSKSEQVKCQPAFFGEMRGENTPRDPVNLHFFVNNRILVHSLHQMKVVPNVGIRVKSAHFASRRWFSRCPFRILLSTERPL